MDVFLNSISFKMLQSSYWYQVENPKAVWVQNYLLSYIGCFCHIYIWFNFKVQLDIKIQQYLYFQNVYLPYNSLSP